MAYSVLLFDMDGTLNDSRPGIVACVRSAISHWNLTLPEESLLGFIGPSLAWSFPHYCGFDRKQTEEAMAYFRQRYESVGMFENSLYPGIRESLEALGAAGFTLAIATSKPLPQARTIADHFDLTRYFSVIGGAPMDESGCKADVIRGILTDLGNPDPATVLMIGDREHDMDGAHTVGIDAAGALWGYGSREELVAHGAEHLFRAPADMTDFLLRRN